MAKTKTARPKPPKFPISVRDRGAFLYRLADRKTARKETLECVTRLLNQGAEDDAEKMREFWIGIYRDHDIELTTTLRINYPALEIVEHAPPEDERS